jgi:hypothetical protein
MMTHKQAISTFKKRFPKLTVLRCIDYADDFYVMEAMENPDVADYNLPYYAISKVSGKITSFVPTLDLDAFFEAVDKRTVYCAY